MQDGIQQGIQQGVQSGKKGKAIEIAKRMLEKKTDIEFIIECTGLTKEEIEGLK